MQLLDEYCCDITGFGILGLHNVKLPTQAANGFVYVNAHGVEGNPEFLRLDADFIYTTFDATGRASRAFCTAAGKRVSGKKSRTLQCDCDVLTFSQIMRSDEDAPRVVLGNLRQSLGKLRVASNGAIVQVIWTADETFKQWATVEDEIRHVENYAVVSPQIKCLFYQLLLKQFFVIHNPPPLIVSACTSMNFG